MAYNHVFFAHKRPDETISEGYIFKHIYESPNLTRNCGGGPCFKIRVSESKNGKKSDYWCWKRFEDEKYKFISHSRHLVEMASPDYFERDIRENRGKLVNLKLEEICELK
jgi:hypothetical protein